MAKGERTRQTIIGHALGLASKVGIGGLSIGRLAEDLGMSKSGLIAHFRTMETLQVEVLRAASQRYVEEVIRPALKAPRGEPRLRALFAGFFAWESSPSLPGGCPLIAAASELDDRPGPARDVLVGILRDWFDLLEAAVRGAIEERHFRDDVDPAQFAHDLYGVMLAYHHASRLLSDARARTRAEAAFEALLVAARAERAITAPARRS